MPKYLAILLSILLVFMTAAIGFGGYRLYQNSLPTSQITVTENLKKNFTPNEAIVTLFVDKSGENLAALNSENDKIISKVVEFLTVSGVTKENIKSNKSSNEDYNYSPTGERGTKIIRMNSTVEVKFTSLEKDINEILTKTLDLGINSFGQVDYRIKDQEKICTDLQQETESKLKTKIDTKIQSLKASLVSIQFNQSFDNLCNGTGVYPMYRSAGIDTKTGGAATAENVLSSGQKELSYESSAIVTYR